MNKKFLLSTPLAILSTLLLTTSALAYDDYYSTTSSGEDALFGSLFLGGFVFLCYCIPMVLYLIFYIWSIVWTYKDGMKKNNPNTILWTVLVFLFGFIAFIIYLLIRKDHLKNAGTETTATTSDQKDKK
jgi:phosphotransferase system  glucose/maltose/N-acetylglucosamine-specific IIC component